MIIDIMRLIAQACIISVHGNVKIEYCLREIGIALFVFSLVLHDAYLSLSVVLRWHFVLQEMMLLRNGGI